MPGSLLRSDFWAVPETPYVVSRIQTKIRRIQGNCFAICTISLVKVWDAAIGRIMRNNPLWNGVVWMKQRENIKPNEETWVSVSGRHQWHDYWTPCKTKVAKGEDILDWVEQNAWFDYRTARAKKSKTTLQSKEDKLLSSHHVSPLPSVDKVSHGAQCQKVESSLSLQS